MPTPVTQAELRSRVRRITDHESGAASTRLVDAEIDAYLDLHLAELYELLLTAYGSEWAYNEEAFDTVAGRRFYPLEHAEAPVRTLLGVEVEFSDTRYPLFPMGPRGETSRDFSQQTWRKGMRIYYRFLGLGADTAGADQIADDHPLTIAAGFEVWPVPAAAYVVWYYFVPAYVGMGTFYGSPAVTSADDVHRWSWYAVYKTAADIMLKSEEDPSPYLAKAAEMEARIRSSRHNRDAGGAERAKDMRRARRAGGLFR